MYQGYIAGMFIMLLAIGLEFAIFTEMTYFILFCNLVLTIIISFVIGFMHDNFV